MKEGKAYEMAKRLTKGGEFFVVVEVNGKTYEVMNIKEAIKNGFLYSYEV